MRIGNYIKIKKSHILPLTCVLATSVVYDIQASNNTEPIGWKVAILEAIVLTLLSMEDFEKEKKKEQLRRNRLKLDYAKIVENMAILVGAGMASKQAWNKISARYSCGRNEKKESEEHPGYELLVRGSKKMADGLSERDVYRMVAQEAGTIEYNRFSRLLVQNLEKGSRSLAPLLEDECDAAFVERKRIAKKTGEEASTKLLFPMIIMMCIVMAIVIAPALVNFTI